MTIASGPGTAQDVLRDAVRWRLLGLLFERPRAGWGEEVDSLAHATGDEHLCAAAEAARGVSEGAYQAALGPGAPVSPREVAHRRREDPGAILAELKAFYESFAFVPRAEDPVDHVAIEVGFAGYLRLKEAYARTRGDDEAAETCRLAFERFCERHLRFIAEPLSEYLDGSPVPHAALAARVLFETVGASPAGPDGALLPDEDTSEFGCFGGPCPASPEL